MKQKQDISLLRIIATLAVILLHTCSTLADNPERFQMTEIQALTLISIRDAMRWCVPVFFMITGILLLNKEKTITPEMCVKKYAFRMVLVLLVFGIPFAMMQNFMETKQFSLELLTSSVLAVVNDAGWKHLWYIYTLIGIYLMFPVIKKFSDNATEEEMKHITLWLFLFDFIAPFIDALTGTEIGIALPVTYPVFYLFAGKYLSEHTPKQCKNKKITGIFLIFLLALLLLAEIFAPSVAKAMKAYTSPYIAVVAGLLYLLFKDIQFSEKTGNLLWKLDRICFGAYIVHPFFIHLMYKFFKITPLSYPLWTIMIFVFFFIFALLAFSASFLLGLIKPLKKHIL